MKTIVAVVGFLVLICPWTALGQNTTMYDYSYRGPLNRAGVPRFKYIQQPRPAVRQPQQQAQYPPQMNRQNAPASRMYNRLRQVGKGFLGFLPAPLRGTPQNLPAPGTARVTITNVPGVR